MVQVNNATGTTTQYKPGASSETFPFAIRQEGEVLNPAYRYFNEDGWNDLGFNVGTRTNDNKVTAVQSQTVRIFYYKADTQLEKLTITFRDDEKNDLPPSDGLTYNRDTDNDGNNDAYEMTAHYDLMQGIYYVALTNKDMEKAWQIDAKALVPVPDSNHKDMPAKFYTMVFSDAKAETDAQRAEAKQLAQDVADKIRRGETLDHPMIDKYLAFKGDWTADDYVENVLPLSETSANTNFYIVAAPIEHTAYPSTVVTLRVMKLEPNIVASTVTKGAIVRQVQVDTGEVGTDGEHIYSMEDFLLYDDPNTTYAEYPNGAQVNPYYVKNADGSYYYDDVMTLAGKDAAGVARELPTFVVKVRYPDDAPAGESIPATLKLTTENVLTMVQRMSNATDLMGSAVKANEKDLSVSFQVDLRPESAGYTAFKFRASLSLDGQTATPKDYLVIVQYAERGTDLVRVLGFKGNSYSGDQHGTAPGGVLGDIQPDKDFNIRKVVDEKGKVSYYVAVPGGSNSNPGTMYLEAAAGTMAVGPDGKPYEQYSLKSSVSISVTDELGNFAAFTRENLSDLRYYLARIPVKLYPDQMEKEGGQKVMIRVIDEAGTTKDYELKIVFRSTDTEIAVRTRNTDLSAEPLTAQTFQDKDNKTQNYYSTYIDRNAGTMPFRITAKSTYTNIWMDMKDMLDSAGNPVTDSNGNTVKTPNYYFGADRRDIANAMTGHAPDASAWAANVDENGNPISDLMGALDLTDEDLRKALETGIYVPFYVRAEDNSTTELRFLKFRWSFDGLLVEDLIADYDWYYVGNDGKSSHDEFRNIHAVKDKTTKDQVYSLTIPSDLEQLDLTLIPEMPVTSYILFDELQTLVDDPTALDYSERTDYVLDGELGIYNKRVNIPLKDASGKEKSELLIYMYVPSGKVDSHGRETLLKIPVTLKLERISTDRTLKSLVTNAKETYAHEAVYNHPKPGEYLTYIPDSTAYTTADFTATLNNVGAQIKVLEKNGAEHDYQTVKDGIFNFQRGFSKSNDDYETISGDTKGFRMDMSVLSAYGQYRLAQIITENNALIAANKALPEGDVNKRDEEQLKAELDAKVEAEYNKHTLTHKVTIVPTDMNLDVAVNYTRKGESEILILERDENDAYSVYDYKANDQAEQFIVESIKHEKVKLELLDAAGNPVYVSTDENMPGDIDVIRMRAGSDHALDTGFTPATPDDYETKYSIRISSTQDGVTTADGTTAYLNRTFPFTIRPMSEDTGVRVWVSYTDTETKQEYRNEAKYNKDTGTFTAPIGLTTTEVKVEIQGVNAYTKPALDLLGKDIHGDQGALSTIYAADGTILAKSEFDYPTLKDTTSASGDEWERMWTMARANFASVGNTFTAQLFDVRENYNTPYTAATMRVQAMAQDEKVVARFGSDYGYLLQLNRQSNKAELTVFNDYKQDPKPAGSNANYKPDPEYYPAKDESTEKETILVLYLDPYTAGVGGTASTGDYDALARLQVSEGAYLKLTDKATGRPVSPFPSDFALGTTVNPGNLQRGEYTVTVMAQDQNPANTKVYTLIVKDKSTEVRTGFVAAEGEMGEYRIYHDAGELDAAMGTGTKADPYKGFIPTIESTLKVDPVDRNAIITKIERFSDAAFNTKVNDSRVDDYKPSNGLLYDVYAPLGETHADYAHGAAVIETPSGMAGSYLYYAVTLESQARNTDGTPVNTETFYVALERLDVDVDVDYVRALVGSKVNNAIRPDPAGNLFNLNVAEAEMKINIKTKDEKAKVTGFAATESSADNNIAPVNRSDNFTTDYVNTAADGSFGVVHFQVTHDFYAKYGVDKNGRVLTPNARKMFIAQIFRSNHDTTVGEIWIVDPTDDTWEHKLPAFARPNNPTFFEVSADPSAEIPWWWATSSMLRWMRRRIPI